jgi:hypothetical protein
MLSDKHIVAGQLQFLHPMLNFFFFAKLFILCRVNDLRALEVSRKKKFWLSVEVIAIKVIILSLAVFVL